MKRDGRRINKEYLNYFMTYCQINNKTNNRTNYFRWVDAHNENYSGCGKQAGTGMTLTEWLIENIAEEVLFLK